MRNSAALKEEREKRKMEMIKKVVPHVTTNHNHHRSKVRQIQYQVYLQYLDLPHISDLLSST
jgi:hypothetical protein